MQAAMRRCQSVSRVRAPGRARTSGSRKGRVTRQAAHTARRLIGRFHPLPIWSTSVAGSPHTAHRPSKRAIACRTARSGARLRRSGIPPPRSLQIVCPKATCRSGSVATVVAIPLRTWRTSAAAARQSSLQYGVRRLAVGVSQFGQVPGCSVIAPDGASAISLRRWRKTLRAWSTRLRPSSPTSDSRTASRRWRWPFIAGL